MANVIVQRKIGERVAVILWILTFALLIYACVLDLDKINYDIQNVSPAPAVEGIDPEEYGMDMSEFNHDDSEGTNTARLNNNQYLAKCRQELMHRRSEYICWLVGISVYGVVCFIFYFTIKDKSKNVVLLCVLLSMVNLIVYNLLPI